MLDVLEFFFDLLTFAYCLIMFLEQVRVLIPMRTHPLWGPSELIPSLRGTTPVAATLLQHRRSWLAFHGLPLNREEATDRTNLQKMMQMAVFHLTWLFLIFTMIYPYAMIIFIIWKRSITHGSSDDKLSLLLVASATSAAWTRAGRCCPDPVCNS